MEKKDIFFVVLLSFILCDILPVKGICGNMTCYYGSCQGEVCNCYSGYSGSTCDKPICERGCLNNGTCSSPDYCSCPFGFSGRRCEIELNVCDSASHIICYNNGTCENGICSCTELFTGPQCLTNLCDPPCQNNGSCNGGNYCSCYFGFNGRHCENAPGPACAGSYCFNNGTCKDTGDGCDCPVGYLPPFCRYRDCIPPCQNNASCYDGYCSCPFGYSGRSCEIELNVCGAEKYIICYNNGTCENGTCSCTEQFTGPQCLTDLCDPPCQNNGSCLGGNYCSCTSGFSGRYCENAPGPACAGSYCFNNGTCNAAADGCDCPVGYLPPFCRYRDCNPPCQNNASCYDGYCSCPFGYSGRSCEIELNVCDSESHIICYNNGTCENGICSCTNLFTGPQCLKNLCDPPCQNNGSCYGGNYCSCNFGFSGRRCEDAPGPACAGSYCFNNGTCNDAGDGCDCPVGYLPPFCRNRDCNPPCQNNASCYDGYCSCPFGYSGRSCEIEEEVCGSYICSNNGTCVNNQCECSYPYTGYACQDTICNTYCNSNGTLTCLGNECRCYFGYTGKYCETKTYGCVGYCLFGGSCMNGTCHCLENFTGETCDEEICDPACENGYCNDNRCICTEGFNGATCNIPPGPACNGSYCWNNGNCDTKTNSCICTERFTGAECRREICVPECLNNGSCFEGKCICPYGFTGGRCETPPGPACGGYYCFNGTCDVASQRCNCKQGFEPPYCQYRSCVPICQNNGSCFDGYCYCPYDYYGKSCELETKYCKFNGQSCLYGQCDNVTESCVCQENYMGFNCNERMCIPPCQNNGSCFDGFCSCPYPFRGSSCEIGVKPSPSPTTTPSTPCLTINERIGELNKLFTWPMTPYGDEARIQCPCDNSPELTRGQFAFKRCSEDGRWMETDYAACIGEALEAFCIDGDSLEDVFANIDIGKLKTGDVAIIANAIANSMDSSVVNNPMLRINILKFVDMLLSADENILKETSETSEIANRIENIFENINSNINLANGESFAAQQKHFALFASQIEIGNIPSTGFSVSHPGRSDAEATIPRSVFGSLSTTAARVSSAIISETIFSGRNRSLIVSSSVFSLTLYILGETVSDLIDPVSFRLTKKMNAAENMRMTCMFWDDSDGLGFWSENGCEVLRETSEFLYCQCDHLTSFAVIQAPNSSSATPSLGTAAINIAAIVVPLVVGTLLIITIVIVIGVVIFVTSKKKGNSRDSLEYSMAPTSDRSERSM